MKVEQLDKEILTILAVQDDYPLSDELIQAHLVACGLMLGVGEIRARLNFLKERGWVDFRVDDYRKKLWFITESGKTHRRQ